MSAPERRTGGIRPAAAITASGVLLLVLSGSTRNGWLVLLAGLCFGLVVAALVLRPRLHDLAVEVRLPSRATAGEVLPAHVIVANHGRRATPASTVHLHAPGLRCTTVAVPPLAAGAVATADAEVATTARGVLTRLTAVAQTSAPFGIVSVAAQHEIPVDLLVRPVPELPMHHVPAGRGGDAERTRPGPGVDVQGVREWRHGDSARRLHVRSTARHGRPIVLDRHDDLANGVAVVVGGPGGSSSHEQHPLWEALIAVVGSTLADAARSGHRVAAVAAQPGLPDLVGGDADDALDWCARLTAPGPPTGEAVRRAAAAVGAGGTVAVADVTWSSRAPWWPACVSAASAADVTLLVLHPFVDRTDALCLHDAREDVHGVGSAAAAEAVEPRR